MLTGANPTEPHNLQWDIKNVSLHSKTFAFRSLVGARTERHTILLFITVLCLLCLLAIKLKSHHSMAKPHNELSKRTRFLHSSNRIRKWKKKKKNVFRLTMCEWLYVYWGSDNRVVDALGMDVYGRGAICTTHSNRFSSRLDYDQHWMNTGTHGNYTHTLLTMHSYDIYQLASKKFHGTNEKAQRTPNI